MLSVQILSSRFPVLVPSNSVRSTLGEVLDGPPSLIV